MNGRGNFGKKPYIAYSYLQRNALSYMKIFINWIKVFHLISARKSLHLQFGTMYLVFCNGKWQSFRICSELRRGLWVYRGMLTTHQIYDLRAWFYTCESDHDLFSYSSPFRKPKKFYWWLLSKLLQSSWVFRAIKFENFFRVTLTLLGEDRAPLLVKITIRKFLALFS